MVRLRRDLQPDPPIDAEIERTYWRVRYLFFASEDGSPAAALSVQIRHEADRLDSIAGSLRDRLDALLGFVDELGAGDAARRVLDALTRRTEVQGS